MGGSLVARNARFLTDVSGPRLRDWESVLIALHNQVQDLKKENEQLRERLRTLEERSDEMYYAPGMPGFYQAETRFNNQTGLGAFDTPKEIFAAGSTET